MMARNILILGRAGSINTRHVLAVANAQSAPVQRMIDATDEAHVINMTYGSTRRSVIVLEGGYLVLSHRTVDALANALGSVEETADEDEEEADQPPWW
ncbi:MAG: DUF370 domain-containing protein [Anaerolineaceae bacterium]|nr:DUF370 domain-containing protein [Anaerolineaceae bacterium]